MKKITSLLFLANLAILNASPLPEGYFFATPELASQHPELQQGLFYHEDQPLWIRGINWYGIGVQDCDPLGLWTTDYLSLFHRIREAGFNAIRLVSNGRIVRAERLGGDTTPITCVAYDIGSNNNLRGKSQYEMMRILIEGCEEAGLMVLLDHHTMGYEDGVWFEEGEGTAEDYIADLVYVAEDFRHYKNIIGLDIINEPWQAYWGNGEINDFHAFAQKAGKAILKVAPEWMVCVEGVQYFHHQDIKNATPLPEGADPNNVSRGENLTEVRACPLDLPHHKIIYSPHVYASWHGTYVNESMAPRFDEILPPINEYRWGYLSGEYAVMLGEFGAVTVEEGGKYWEQAWLVSMIRYISRKDLPGFFYWCVNPDPLGLMVNWTTFNESKMRLIRPAFGIVEASGRDSSLCCERDYTVYQFPEGTFPPEAHIVHSARCSDSFIIPPHPGLESINREIQIKSTHPPASPYRIIMHYTEAQLRNFSESSLACYHWDGTQWIKIEPSLQNLKENSFHFNTDKTGLFAIMAQ